MSKSLIERLREQAEYYKRRQSNETAAICLEAAAALEAQNAKQVQAALDFGVVLKMYMERAERAEKALAAIKASKGGYTTDVDRHDNDTRCAKYGCDETNQLQFKWRTTLPAKFDIEECEAAILDAFIRQGGAHVWRGDGSSCAAQIVEAVWKSLEEAQRDAARYRNIREGGIPCMQGDDCGSCTGDELDAQIDDAIAHPEKYDV